LPNAIFCTDRRSGARPAGAQMRGNTDWPPRTHANRWGRAVFQHGAQGRFTLLQAGDFRAQFGQFVNRGKVAHGGLLWLQAHLAGQHVNNLQRPPK
jgi:hypothetical protein